MRKLTVFNAEAAYFYFTDEAFRRWIVGSEILYCDSFSLSLVLRLCGIRHARLNGPDFMELYLERHPANRIMILGGSEQAHRTIQSKYRLQNARVDDRKVSLDDLDGLFAEVAAFRPDMVFVCLGLYKQDAVSAAICARFADDADLGDAASIGVGAAVDFLGETKVRSGPIWRKLGLEWLPRVIREPRMVPRIWRSLLGCGLTIVNSGQFREDRLTFAERFDA